MNYSYEVTHMGQSLASGEVYDCADHAEALEDVTAQDAFAALEGIDEGPVVIKLTPA
jgi:hypothetical protein